MTLFSIYAVSLLNLILAISYFVLIFQRKIRPSLAMWVFFTLAIGMSLFTYLKDGQNSMWDNILNTTDLFFVSSVAISVFLFGDRSTRFNRFDLFCLGIVTLVVIFWLVTQNHLITNLLVQAILVIAYFPVINRMMRTGENHESYLLWGGMLLASVLAMLSVKGGLAVIYTIRAVISTALLMAIMRYTDLRKKSVPVEKEE